MAGLFKNRILSALAAFSVVSVSLLGTPALAQASETPEEPQRSLPQTLAAVESIPKTNWDTFGDNGVYGTASAYVSGNGYRAACAFNTHLGPSPYNFANNWFTYSKSQTITGSGTGINGSGSYYGPVWFTPGGFQEAAYVTNKFLTKNGDPNKAAAASAVLWDYTNQPGGAAGRSLLWKNPVNPQLAQSIKNQARANRGPYTSTESGTYHASKTLGTTTYKNVVTFKYGLKGGSGNYVEGVSGISATLELTNATFVNGKTTANYPANGSLREVNVLATTPGKPVSMKITHRGLPSPRVNIYYSPDGAGRWDRWGSYGVQNLIIGGDTYSSAKTLSVNTPSTPVISTAATLDETSFKVKDVVTVTGLPASGAVNLKADLYYAGTSKPAQSTTVPASATLVTSMTKTATADTSGKASWTTADYSLDGKTPGYYTWVVTASGSNLTTTTSAYGVPAETVFLDPNYVPSISSGAAIMQQANGTWTATDSVVVTDAPQGTVVKVDYTLYYHGTSKPTEVKTVPANAKVVATGTASATADANKTAKVTFTKTGISGNTDRGYYTWVTTASGKRLDTVTTNYGIPSETVYKDVVTPKISTTTTQPAFAATSVNVRDAITITGPKNQAVSYTAKLYYHGTTKPTQVAVVPSGKTLVQTLTGSGTFSATGEYKVTTANVNLLNRAEGYYTWVVSASGAGFEATTSPYGVASETFQYIPKKPDVITTASRPELSPTTVTLKDTVNITGGLPGGTVKVTAKAYHSTTKPTQSSDIPSGATQVAQSNEISVVLDANGNKSGTVLTLTPARPGSGSQFSKPGYITWVVTATGGGFQTTYTSDYGVPSETVEWTGANPGVTTQTSEATAKGTGLVATDTLLVSGGSANKSFKGDFQLYYHGASKPSQQKTVPSTAKKIGSLQTVTGTLDAQGNAQITSPEVAIPASDIGWYTWVANYGEGVPPVPEVIVDVAGGIDKVGVVTQSGRVYQTTISSTGTISSNWTLLPLPSDQTATKIAGSGVGDWGVITSQGNVYTLNLAGSTKGTSPTSPVEIEGFGEGGIWGILDADGSLYDSNGSPRADDVEAFAGKGDGTWLIQKKGGDLTFTPGPGGSDYLLQTWGTTLTGYSLTGGGSGGYAVISAGGWDFNPEGDVYGISSQIVNGSEADMYSISAPSGMGSVHGKGTPGSNWWFLNKEKTQISTPDYPQGASVGTAKKVVGGSEKAGALVLSTGNQLSQVIFDETGQGVNVIQNQVSSPVYDPSSFSYTSDYGIPSETFRVAGVAPGINITSAWEPVKNMTEGTVEFTDSYLQTGATPNSRVEVTGQLYYAGTTKPTAGGPVPTSAVAVGSLVSSGVQTVSAEGILSVNLPKVSISMGSAKEGYYTWVTKLKSVDGLYPTQTSGYGEPTETVYYEGLDPISVSSTAGDIVVNATTSAGTLTDTITLSGTPGVTYSATAQLYYHGMTAPTEVSKVPTGATKVGALQTKTGIKLGADGTASFTTNPVTLTTGPNGGAQPGYYTWVVEATSTAPSGLNQTVTSNYGIPSETVFFEGWKQPAIASSATTNAAGTASSDVVTLAQGTPGQEVTVTAQLYYAGTKVPAQSKTVPSGATTVGSLYTGKVSLGADGKGSLTIPAVTLPIDSVLGVPRPGFYTWVVSAAGTGFEKVTSDYGIPEETIEIAGPEEGTVAVTTELRSSKDTRGAVAPVAEATSVGDLNILNITSGTTLTDTFTVTGDDYALSKVPVKITATLWGPLSFYEPSAADQEKGILGTINPSSATKVFETVLTTNKSGTFTTAASGPITEPGRYAWTYSYESASLTSQSGVVYPMYKGVTDLSIYPSEAAQLLYNPKTSTQVGPAHIIQMGDDFSDKVTVSGYLPNTDITVDSQLWGPFYEKPTEAATSPIPECVEGDEECATLLVQSFSNTVKTNASGSATFTVKGEVDGPDGKEPLVLEPGYYYWTDTITSIDGWTSEWESNHGIPSETFQVVNVMTQGATFNEVASEGIILSDTADIYGPMGTGNVTFRLYEQGARPQDDTLVYTSSSVPVNTSGWSEENPTTRVKSPDVKVTEKGTYYWRAEATSSELAGFSATDAPRLPSETVQLFTARSDAKELAKRGEPIFDTITIEGGFPAGIMVGFDLYKVGSGGVETDTLVKDPALWFSETIEGEEGVAKTLEGTMWYPSGLSGEPILNGKVEVKSPEVVVPEAGEYYWISKVGLPSGSGTIDPEADSEVGQMECPANPQDSQRASANTCFDVFEVFYKDAPRLENETSKVTPGVTTKTKSVEHILNSIFDTATLDGPAPAGSYLEFELWEQGTGGVNTDTKKETLGPVSVSAKGDYDSPKTKVDKSGVYYWVEKLYSPDPETPGAFELVAQGTPRLPNETVHVPSIGTKASAGQGNNGEGALNPDDQVTIIDEVSYTNLLPGKQYTVQGILMYQDGTQVLVDGKTVTAEAEFTPTTKNGTVNVTFTFNASSLQGKSLVVFEKLFVDGNLVADHEDPNDPDQTVEVSPLGFYLEKLSPNKEILVGSEWELRSGATVVAKPTPVPGVDPEGSLLFFDKAKPGSYDLWEVKAPAGYAKLPNPVKVTISAGGAITVSSEATVVSEGLVALPAGTAELPVIQVGNEQKKPLTLPKLGGTGIAIFAALGGGTLLGAALIGRRLRKQSL